MLEKYFPTHAFRRVEDIPFDLIHENNIKCIMFDMDNTLVNLKYEATDDLKAWLKSVKDAGIKCYILSNSRRGHKVKKVAEMLTLDYILNAKKPELDGFLELQKKVNLPKENLAIIGDQIFTDILGGNRFGITTILVKPIQFLEVPEGMIKRPAEVPIKLAYWLNRRKSS